MDEHKYFFYEKLSEYESHLPQKYDREKFVLFWNKVKFYVHDIKVVWRQKKGKNS